MTLIILIHQQAFEKLKGRRIVILRSSMFYPMSSVSLRNALFAKTLERKQSSAIGRKSMGAYGVSVFFRATSQDSLQGSFREKSQMLGSH